MNPACRYLASAAGVSAPMFRTFSLDTKLKLFSQM